MGTNRTLFLQPTLQKAWTTARIATFGNITENQKESQQPTVYHKVWAKQGLLVNELTVKEKKMLQEDLKLGKPNNDLGDMYAA